MLSPSTTKYEQSESAVQVSTRHVFESKSFLQRDSTPDVPSDTPDELVFSLACYASWLNQHPYGRIA
jgi:hypothetical protein